MKFPLTNIYNRKSLIYLFGRQPNGDLIIKKIHDFLPYYYEPDKKGEFVGYDGTLLKKITVNEPSEVKELRSDESWESDIRYCVRYTIDKIDNFELCPLKWAMIDVEIMHPEDKFPDPMEAKFPISSISLYNSKYNKFRTWYLGDYGNDIEIGEQKLFVDFITYLRKAKFDIIFGWNGILFDYPILYSRFSKMPQKLFFDNESKYNNFAKAISPIGEVRSSGVKDLEIFFPAGTSIIDYISYLKRVYKEERSYALDAIMEKYLGKGKEFKTVDFSKLSEQVRLRNQGDVRGMVELELNKFKLIPLYDEIRRFAKVGWEDFNYNSRIIDSLILQEAKDKQVILPMRRRYGEIIGDKFEGAYRATLETGSFFNVGKYDLDSCYLNIIKGLNLDTSNIVSDDKEGITINITDRKTNTIIHNYKVKQNFNAIIPSVVSKLLEAKVKYKKLKKETNTELPEYKDAELKYNAIKAVILSCWGVLGNEYFRLFDKRVAEMITSVSRELLHYLQDKADENNFRVIYLDTDSIFCIDNGKDISKFLNDSILEWANKNFGKDLPINLEKEGNFESIIILKMCRYKGWLRTPSGLNEEIRGIQSKRRDSSTWIIKFQDTLLNKILNKESEISIMEWVKSEIERIKSVSIQDISFPAKVSKKIGEYKTEITNKKGNTYTKDVPIFARALRNSNLKLRLGEGYFWCYVKSDDPKKNVMAFTELSQKEIKNCDIDWEMMTQRNILAICETIFEAMKWENPFIPQKIKRVKKEPITQSQPTYTESDFLGESGDKKIEVYYSE